MQILKIPFQLHNMTEIRTKYLKQLNIQGKKVPVQDLAESGGLYGISFGCPRFHSDPSRVFPFLWPDSCGSSIHMTLHRTRHFKKCLDNVFTHRWLLFFHQTVLCEWLKFVLCLKQMQQKWIRQLSFTESSWEIWETKEFSEVTLMHLLHFQTFWMWKQNYWAQSS